MPAFAYEAVDPRGKRVRGAVEAASLGAVTRSLEERGLLVLEVGESAMPKRSGGFGFGRRRDVLEVTRALAALLPAGMPLAPALGAASNIGTGDVGRVILEVKSRVERGDMLSDALAAYPQFFPPLYIGVVRAGEKSGDLDAAFVRLSAQLERDEALRGRLLSAAIYPMLLATVGTIAVTILVTFVLPRFVDLLQGSGATLPASTAFLLAISSAARRHWYLLLLVPVGIAALVTWANTTEDGRRAWGTLLLKLPVVRTLRRYALAARFARLTGVLLGGGAPIVTALDDAIDSTIDPLARDEMTRVRTLVRDGSSLRAALAAGDLYPMLLWQLVAVGEESGRMQEFLLKAADIFEEKTERATQRVSTMAEPAMIVIFGAIVAFVALSLLQAIYGVNTTTF